MTTEGRCASAGPPEQRRARFGWPRPRWIGLVALFAILFGIATVTAGGTVLFVAGPARAAAGEYVPFVVWFNFLAGFAYVATGMGLWQRAAWAPPLAGLIAAGTLVVSAAFGVHVLSGRPYELRTIIALLFRTLSWGAIGILAWRSRPVATEL